MPLMQIKDVLLHYTQQTEYHRRSIDEQLVPMPDGIFKEVPKGICILRYFKPKIVGRCGGWLDYGLTGKLKPKTMYRVVMVSTNGTGEAKVNY